MKPSWPLLLLLTLSLTACMKTMVDSSLDTLEYAGDSIKERAMKRMQSE